MHMCTHTQHTHVHTHNIHKPHTYRVHAVTVKASAVTVLAAVDAHLQELGVEGVASRDLVDIIEGYTGAGTGEEERGEQVGEGGRWIE